MGQNPFAVMVADVFAAGTIAVIDSASAVVGQSGAPRVVGPFARRRTAGACGSRQFRSSGDARLHALHHLLFDAGAPAVLVMTSVQCSPMSPSVSTCRSRRCGWGDRRCFRHHDRVIQVA